MILDIIGQLKGPQSGTSLRNRLTSLFGMALEVPQKAETVTEMMIFPIIQDQLSHALELNLLFFLQRKQILHAVSEVFNFFVVHGHHELEGRFISRICWVQHLKRLRIYKLHTHFRIEPIAEEHNEDIGLEVRIRRSLDGQPACPASYLIIRKMAGIEFFDQLGICVDLVQQSIFANLVLPNSWLVPSTILLDLCISRVLVRGEQKSEPWV